MRRKRIIRRYRYFMFLNSSVRGPFYPSYQPQGWAWPRAFTDRLSADVKVVASSIVCLPEVDAGGFGPKARRSRVWNKQQVNCDWRHCRCLMTASIDLLGGVFYLCADGPNELAPNQQNAEPNVQFCQETYYILLS